MDFEAVRELCGRKRTLEILDTLGSRGALNYSDIERRVDTSSDVIVDSLDVLVDYGLVHRTERSSKDVRYAITEKGEDVLAKIRSLEGCLIDE